jgi:hypothetical protein
MKMAEKHPYVSGSGGLVKAIQQLRNSLPSKIDAYILKKLGIAPKNESYLINVLKFLSVIDDDGTPTDEARATFSQHDDSAFGKKLSEMMKKAYSELFGLHGEKAWNLDNNALVTFFRQSDQTSAVVGSRQAMTFQTLAAFAGHGEVPSARQSTPRKGKASIKKAKSSKQTEVPSPPSPNTGTGGGKDIGLTVRIEINLPEGGDQATYDRIFKSIRENLLNG